MSDPAKTIRIHTCFVCKKPFRCTRACPIWHRVICAVCAASGVNYE